MVANPASVAVDYAFDSLIRAHFFKGVRFDSPAGDPGWFGPSSAVWYVHEHNPALVLGLFASAAIETLHPDFAWMGQDHSRGVRRVDGEPVGLDPKGLLTRAGHSHSFFMAVAYGSSDAAERVTRAVRGMHHTIRGVRPDGASVRRRRSGDAALGLRDRGVGARRRARAVPPAPAARGRPGRSARRWAARTCPRRRPRCWTACGSPWA